MNHLAIDTATEILSVALRVEGSHTRSYHEIRDEGLHHARMLLPMVDRLLGQAGLCPGEIDLVSCMRGPGSFTGLRIGMATAKGIASAVAGMRDLSALPLVSVPTLDVMAAATDSSATLVMPLIDGRKGRYYAAVYSAGTRLTEDLDLEPRRLLTRARDLLCDVADGDVDTGGVLLCGPHVCRFMRTLGSGEPPEGLELFRGADFRGGYAVSLLEQAEHHLKVIGYDAVDEGPRYVRRSDAELSRDS